MVLLLWVLLCICTTARAESLGMLRLPANIASLPDEDPIDILNPPAASTAWAKPGHRPLGVTLSNYDLTQEQIEAVRQTGMGLARLYIPMEKFLTAEDADWATLDQVISRLTQLRDGQLRFFGLTSMLLGLAALWFLS